MLNKYFIFLCVLLVLFNIITCSTSDTSGTGRDGEDQTYEIRKNELLNTEYSVYKYLQDEDRYIYTAGKVPVNDGSYKLIWWFRSTNGSYEKITTDNKIGINTTNTYWNDSTGHYTLPLRLHVPQDFLPFQHRAITIHIGDGEQSLYQHQVEIEMIWDRVFNIDYYSQYSYDITSSTVAHDFESKLHDAFGEAGTFMWFNKINNTIPDASVSLEEIVDYAEDYTGNFNNYNPDHAILFSVAQHDSSPGIKGITRIFTRSEGDYPNKRYALSYVFVEYARDWLSSTYGFDDIERDKAVTWIAIHELAHAREKDPPRSWRHNGYRKTLCVFEEYPPSIGTIDGRESIRKMINDPRFCEGHIQHFINVNW